MNYVLLTASAFLFLALIVAGVGAGDAMETCQQKHTFDVCAGSLWR